MGYSFPCIIMQRDCESQEHPQVLVHSRQTPLTRKISASLGDTDLLGVERKVRFSALSCGQAIPGHVGER